MNHCWAHFPVLCDEEEIVNTDHMNKKAKNHTPDPKILGCDENSTSLHLQIISMHDIKKLSKTGLTALIVGCWNLDQTFVT